LGGREKEGVGMEDYIVVGASGSSGRGDQREPSVAFPHGAGSLRGEWVGEIGGFFWTHTDGEAGKEKERPVKRRGV